MMDIPNTVEPEDMFMERIQTLWNTRPSDNEYRKLIIGFPLEFYIKWNNLENKLQSLLGDSGEVSVDSVYEDGQETTRIGRVIVRPTNKPWMGDKL